MRPAGREFGSQQDSFSMRHNEIDGELLGLKSGLREKVGCKSEGPLKGSYACGDLWDNSHPQNLSLKIAMLSRYQRGLVLK